MAMAWYGWIFLIVLPVLVWRWLKEKGGGY